MSYSSRLRPRPPASPALRAIALRSSAVRFLARALPPRRPSDTAAGSLRFLATIARIFQKGDERRDHVVSQVAPALFFEVALFAEPFAQLSNRCMQLVAVIVQRSNRLLQKVHVRALVHNE